MEWVDLKMVNRKPPLSSGRDLASDEIDNSGTVKQETS